MSEIVVPEDPAAVPKTAARRDGWRIWQYLRERSGVDFESWQLQDALGIFGGYSTRLAYARKFALDHGERITYAVQIDGRWVYKHSFGSDDTGRAVEGGLVRDVTLRAQDANLLRLWDQVARVSEDPVERDFAQAKARATEHLLGVHNAWEGFARRRLQERRDARSASEQ